MRALHSFTHSLTALADCSLGGGTDAKAGVGYALYIDADGQGGSTAACETFACPALIDASDPFARTSSPNKTTSGGGGGAGGHSPVTFEIATTELILLTDVRARMLSLCCCMLLLPFVLCCLMHLASTINREPPDW